MRLLLLPILRFLLLALPIHAGMAQGSTRPNILLILADDLGFSDLGCYGGEIATPHLDALAQGGLRFTQFYNTGRCWPSRASILTGYYAQQVRRDTVAGMPSGTAGSRPPWAPLLSELLRPLGYRSYHSGKWHLDGKPLQNGFDHSYSLNDHDRYFAPRFHTEDDVALPAVSPGSGFYTTTAIADHAIRCLKEHAARYPEKPFFEFLAFTAPHFPVQAPQEDIARYRNRYGLGWDALREVRWKRMQALGLGGSVLSPIERQLGPPYAFPQAIAQLGANEVDRPLPWTELNATQRRFQADKMAVHAAMVDRMDREIGRVLDQIRAMGVLDNTLILFLSDNGASAEMMVRGDGHDPDAQCGTGATFLSIGPGWSSMANTPFRRHKTWVHEGGISTPLILHWPQGIHARGELRHTPGHVVDLVPTLILAAGSALPKSWNGRPVPTPPGTILQPQFHADEPMPTRTLWWQHEGNRALRKGDWKIVASGHENPWELYDLRQDRSEGNNLAPSHPDRVRELAMEWNRQTTLNTELAQKDAPSPYEGWRHSGSIYINTTTNGAALPAQESVEDFPLLIRLHQEFFHFEQASPEGADIRFSTPTGKPLPYEIEQWDPRQGIASIWVRIPRIQGNARQEIRLHWGNPGARSESSSVAVFNRSNDFLGVWHMTDAGKDAVETLDLKDSGTVSGTGVIGLGRHFQGGVGLSSRDQITPYPGGSSEHTIQAWVRAEKPNTTLLGWGREEAQGKVVMQLRSPPHVNMDCYFSDGNVAGKSKVPLGEWVHIVHTYQKGDSRVYVNGVLDGQASHRAAVLSIKTPTRLWLGGWYDQYDFAGDLDEVQISKGVRSPAWIALQYENQKPLQTLVGPLISSGSELSVSPSKITVSEGKSVTITAKADGAEKLYWSLLEDGSETRVATDRLQFVFQAGRVTSTQQRSLRLRAVYPDGPHILDIPITVEEDIPEPIFTLHGPKTWDGRTPLELFPRMVNGAAMTAKGVGSWQCNWSLEGPAVIRRSEGNRLILQRSQGSGILTIRAKVHNGGAPTMATTTIRVVEPKHDPWLQRIPTPEEHPEDNQFYARDPNNSGTLIWNGTIQESAESVFVRVYAADRLYQTLKAKLGSDGRFHFKVRIQPGLIPYRAEWGVLSRGQERVLNTATNLVCGDAYIIQGQSNAVATDWGEGEATFHSPWIRTFGSMSSAPDTRVRWGEAVPRGRGNEDFQIGYWGMELARRLVEQHQIPICILNGAVGGTRIDQHQRDEHHPTNAETIYGRLLWRVQEGRLTHGIRAIFWHQGENDQGADGPTGQFGWETYRHYFIDLAGAWKRDYPNLQHYYLFQIWPKACAMGTDGSDNRLREVQRLLPTAFSNMSLMSTLGIQPPGGCHYPAAGYAELARLITPLVQRDHYGVRFSKSITPPNLLRLEFIDGKRDRIRMTFDQAVHWDDSLGSQFHLEGHPERIVSGVATGSTVVLRLSLPTQAKKLTYVDGASWSQDRLLRGENGIAALSFCEVPILP